MNTIDFILMFSVIIAILAGVLLLSLILKKRFGINVAKDCNGNCESCSKQCESRKPSTLVEDYNKAYHSANK